MNKEKAIQIYMENLYELSKREERTEKQRAIIINGLCESALFFMGGSDIETAYESIMRNIPNKDIRDKALVVSFLASAFDCSRLWSKGFVLSKDKVAAGSHGRVSLVKNEYSELAFERLSSAITRSKAVFASTFADACEDVLGGGCEFCILPIQNDQSGRLFSFYSMLDRYDLKICALCGIEAEERQENIKYALVGKNPPDRRPRASFTNFECSVITADGNFPTDIADAVRLFGGSVTGTDSLPLNYDNIQRKYFFTLYLPERSVSVLDLYLTLEFSGYTPIGIYSLLN